MAIATCPKCTTKLKVPDGTTASVRCPKCQTVFKTSDPAAAVPQFEVVDQAPKPSASTARPAPKPAAAPPPPPVVADDDRPRKKRDDDEDDDRPRKKRRDDEDDDRPRSKKRNRDDDEDEDDRPRKKRRDDDEDDDDRPKSKKRTRDDDDDDDEDDRPRKKRKGGRDDTDYSPPGKGSKFGLARTGVLLVLISLGLYAGSMALQLLFILVALIGGVIPSGLSLVTGLMGLANWVVGLVGLGMCIAGPARARGLAIAAVSVAGVHLILAFITANDTKSGAFSMDSVPALSQANRVETVRNLAKDYEKEVQKNPSSERAKELREELKSHQESGDGRRTRDKDSIRWRDFSTFLPYLDELIFVLSYASKAGFEYGWYLLGFFTGGLELARFILVALLLKSLAAAARAHSAESKAKLGWIVGVSAVGAAMLVLIVIGVILDSKRNDLTKGPSNAAPPSIGPNTDWQEIQRKQQAETDKWLEKLQSAQKSANQWEAVGEFLVLALHVGSVVLPALAAMAIFSATRSGGGGGRDRGRKRGRRQDDDDEDD